MTAGTLRLAALAVASLLAAQALAQPAIPNYWDERERLPRPDLSSYERIRFLTTIDFPPLSHLDADGQLIGFHVDLARALCETLDIVEKCQIQALPWDELDAAMSQGNGEALIAGTAVTVETRERYAFTRPYLRFPARFLTRRQPTGEPVPLEEATAGKRIGVIADSAHEDMLRAYFPDTRPVTYSRSEWLYEDLREGALDGVFGDGMRLSFWLAGAASGNCCAFSGGPFIAPEYLGAGLAVAVRKEDAVLAQAFDFALREISVGTKFAELYLKHFPVSFY